MEMMSASSQVEEYLDRHQGWFKRCAAPMRVHPIDAQSYDLTLGKFGNFGFEVEPTIALRLLPQHKGIYRIETISDGSSTAIDVNFKELTNDTIFHEFFEKDV